MCIRDSHGINSRTVDFSYLIKQSQEVTRCVARHVQEVLQCRNLPRTSTSATDRYELREVVKYLNALYARRQSGLPINQLNERRVPTPGTGHDAPIQVEREVIAHLLRVRKGKRDPREDIISQQQDNTPCRITLLKFLI